MSLRINNNPMSVNGINNLQKNTSMVGRSMEKLSSGLRINRAADDAAGLIISEQMRAQITGLSTAISNSETAVNMVQTAEGALDEMNSLLNKARSLALQAANEGANDNNQLVANQSELNNIVDSITRIAENTQFGTKKILDGSLSLMRSNNDGLIGGVSIGDHYRKQLNDGTALRGFHSILVTNAATQGQLVIAGGTTGVMTGGTFAAMEGTHEFQKSFTVSVGGQEVSVASGQTKNDFINTLNAVGQSAGFTAHTAATGTVQSGDITLRYSEFGAQAEISYSFIGGYSGASTIAATHTAGTALAATLHLNTGAVGAVAGTGNTQVALAQSGNALVSTTAGQGYRIGLEGMLTISGSAGGDGLYLGILNGMNSGATFQIGANGGQTATVDLDSVRASDLGRSANAQFKSLADLKGGSLTGGFAKDALAVIDKAIDDVTSTRGRLGAFQSNTLETNINSLKVTRENLISAESTIRDVDFAVESANFTKLQIMVQSSTAMLAQANQLPQNVLQLLG